MSFCINAAEAFIVFNLIKLKQQLLIKLKN